MVRNSYDSKKGYLKSTILILLSAVFLFFLMPFSEATNYSENISESTSLSELQDRKADFFKEDEISLTATDKTEKLTILSREVKESLITTTESIKNFFSFRETSDTIGITDIWTKLQGFFKYIQDTLNLSDIISSIAILHRPEEEVVTDGAGGGGGGPIPLKDFCDKLYNFISNHTINRTFTYDFNDLQGLALEAGTSPYVAQQYLKNFEKECGMEMPKIDGIPVEAEIGFPVSIFTDESGLKSSVSKFFGSAIPIGTISLGRMSKPWSEFLRPFLKLRIVSTGVENTVVVEMIGIRIWWILVIIVGVLIWYFFFNEKKFMNYLSDLKKKFNK